MNDWLAALQTSLHAGKSTVRVTLANVRGSAPREAGATMLVGSDRIDDTIGGGHLEWKAIDIARSMLRQKEQPPTRIDRFTLGATLGQCCGGAVELWFERFDASAIELIDEAIGGRGKGLLLMTTLGMAPERKIIDQDQLRVHFPGYQKSLGDTGVALVRTEDGCAALIQRIDPIRAELWLFGAGHVGKALVKVLADLPLRISWIDSRWDMFPSPMPDNVSPLCSDDPADSTRKAPAGTWFLVLTHSHDLDYDICRAILSRDDFAWLGLIGSQTKATRFKQRLVHQGIGAHALSRMTCPIGLSSISSKLPAAIALSVATQLIGLMEKSGEQSCRIATTIPLQYSQASST